MQGIAKGFGHGLLGQVVLRGAKPAGKHQQIAAAFGFLYQITQAARVIPNHMLVQHADAQFRQFAAQKLGVGIDNIAKQQLGSYTNDLRSHGLFRPLSKGNFYLALLRQYRIILSADTASEVRQMLSQKRR